MKPQYRRSVRNPELVMTHKQCLTPLVRRFTKSRAERFDYCRTCKKFINEFLDKIWRPLPKGNNCPRCNAPAFVKLPKENWKNPKYPIYECQSCSYFEERFE